MRQATGILPAPVRRLGAKLYYTFLRHVVEPAPKLTRSVPGPIRIAGFFASPIGLGEGARRQARLIAELRPDVVQVDLTDAIIPDRQILAEPQTKNIACVSSSGGIAIFHTNPPEMRHAFAAANVPPDAYRIGYWVYELQEPPASWRSAAHFVNEVWTPSQFAADALARVIDRPTYVLPPPLKLAAPLASMRERLGIERGNFVVLSAYDVNSSQARKNPEAAIVAFRRAFPTATNVRMIIKASNITAWGPAAASLTQAIDGDNRISLLTTTLTQSEMAGLISDADVILSLHRSEGFGLALAEAMARERVVIATGWSGNLEFMSDEACMLVPSRLVTVSDPQGLYVSGEWAEPDIEAAAAMLVQCHSNVRLRRELGKRAQEYIEQRLGHGLKERYERRLNALGL